MRCTARIFPVTLVKHQSASPLRRRERGGEKSVNRSAHSTNQRTLFPEIPLFTKVPKVVECCKYLQRFPPSVLPTMGLWARGGEATDTACSGELEGGGHRYSVFWWVRGGRPQIRPVFRHSSCVKLHCFLGKTLCWGL